MSQEEEDKGPTATVDSYDYTELKDYDGGEGSFPHVDHSLDNGVRPGMIVEMPLESETVGGSTDGQFWLARVEEVYGPLVKVLLLRGESPLEPSVQWFRHIDLTRQRIYPLGYCQMNKKSLKPPSEVIAKTPEWEKLAIGYLEDPSYETVSMHFIEVADGEGLTPLDRLRVGMVVDVRRTEGHGLPDRFWPAVIRAIRGGFLRLRHLGATDDEAGESEFTLFYRSPRIRATPLQPKSSKDQAAFLREFSPPYPALRDKPGVDKLLAHAERAPADIFATKPSDHKGLRAGQVAEIVHPKSRDKIVPVFIRSIGGNGWLLVVHGDGQESVVQCSDLLPSGFAAANGLPYEKGKKSVEGPKAVIKVGTDTAAESGFATGQRLELVTETQDGRIGVSIADITGVKCHLLVVKPSCDRDSNRTEYILPQTSTSIFPLGWAFSSGLTVTVPRSYLKPSSQNGDGVKVEIGAEDKKDVESAGETVGEKELKIELDSGGGSWCPPIYFNYKCYSSSFLSKARLAGLPQQVGPGAVRLVMSAVMNYLVGSSFKSSAVLKRLEAKTERPREDFVIEEVKGKSRVLHLTAKVEIPTKTRQIEKYLKEVCAKVYACPNLVSTERYSDKLACPIDCQNRPKTEFKDEEEEAAAASAQNDNATTTGAPSLVKRGRKRKKRRNEAEKLLLDEAGRLGSASATPGSSGLATPTESSGEDGDAESSSNASRNVSRSSSPDTESFRKRQRRSDTSLGSQQSQPKWHTLLPKSEMKTRGAKLPDFKLWSKFGSVVREINKTTSQDSPSFSVGSVKGSPGGGGGGNQNSVNNQLYSYHDRHAMVPVCVNNGQGAKRTTRRLELPAAFSISDLPNQEPPSPDPQAAASTKLSTSISSGGGGCHEGNGNPNGNIGETDEAEAEDTKDGPPPIRQIRLSINPEKWTVNDTMRFLAQTSDCAHLAHFIANDQIDGEAFMMLNYPTVKSYWKLKTSTAIQLCQHIESVRLAHMTQFP